MELLPLEKTENMAVSWQNKGSTLYHDKLILTFLGWILVKKANTQNSCFTTKYLET